MTAAHFLKRVSIHALRGILCAPVLLYAESSIARQQPGDPVFPQRPIRIIVASSPGAADDFFARSVGRELEARYGRRVVIDNRAGAGGLIGNAVLSRAIADGHTLGMIGVTRIITELMREEPPYRALADVVGVAHVASITNVLVVTRGLAARSARELVTHARAHPGELNYASLGTGSASHLAGVVFTRALGIDAVHVPFRSISDSFVEMGLGRVHYAIHTLPAVLGPVNKSGLRALAVMTPARSLALPEVPSIVEVGLPEAQFDSWAGIVAPRGTPRRVVEQLHGDIVRGLRNAALRERFLHLGAESVPDSTPDGFMRHMQEEYLRFRALIREGGIRPD